MASSDRTPPSRAGGNGARIRLTTSCLSQKYSSVVQPESASANAIVVTDVKSPPTRRMLQRVRNLSSARPKENRAAPRVGCARRRCDVAGALVFRTVCALKPRDLRHDGRLRGVAFGNRGWGRSA